MGHSWSNWYRSFELDPPIHIAPAIESKAARAWRHVTGYWFVRSWMPLLLSAGLDWRILRLGSSCLVGPPIRLDVLSFPSLFFRFLSFLSATIFSASCFVKLGCLASSCSTFPSGLVIDCLKISGFRYCQCQSVTWIESVWCCDLAHYQLHCMSDLTLYRLHVN